MKFILKPILIFSFCYQLGHPQCDSSYTYINDLPSSVTILAGGDSCFFDNDLDALNDIITANQLSYETPLHLGTQTWLNGRLRFLVAGNYWGGVESPLSVLPESIENLDDLRALYLEWNNLSILPESFYQLTNLMSLYISNNQLEEIGEGIGNLNNLYFLDLGYNQIPSIPDSFCNLENLTYWWMFNNELDQLPDCLCDSLNINWNDDDAAGYPYFAIGGNNLCENIPDCVENSEYFHISLDQFYYTWPVADSQNCDGIIGELTITHEVNWNLVGLPLEVSDASYLNVYPSAVEGTLYGFEGSYYDTDELIAGEGYWLYFNEPGDHLISGTSIDSVTVSLMEGWNLIAGISTTVSVDNFYDPENIIIPGTLYGFEGSYSNETVLEPGNGYWINASSSGEIVISSDRVTTKIVLNSFDWIKQTNTISINGQKLYFGIDVSDEEKPRYSLPPKPPKGAFDVRFSDGWKIASDYGEIEVMNNSQTLIINYKIVEDDNNWILTSESGRKYLLGGAGEIIVSSEEKFILKREQEKPFTYVLKSNFPNPFNPITTIRYLLPEKRNVTLTIYDMTGKEIKKLVNEYQNEGLQEVSWDATDNLGRPVSAGVYIYKMKAGEFIQNKKMVLLK